MNKRIISFACLAFLLTFSQCRRPGEDNTFFSLPHEGTWFSADDPISLVPVHRRDKSHQGKILVSVEQKGHVLYEKSVPRDDPFTIILPGKTESGILKISCYPVGEQEKEQSVEVFYIKGDYGTPRLLYYPPVPMAGSIVEAVCSFDKGEDDPYIRWKLKGRLIQEGYLSEGTDRFCFFGPGEKGNYTLTAEIFPDKPLLVTKSSPVYGECEIFFDDIPDREGELDSGEWENHFNCDGTHIDRGGARDGTRNVGALSYLSSRALSPYVREGDRGYAFDPESYLRFDGKILQGRVSEKSRLAVKLILDKPEEEEKENTVQIFNTRDGTGAYGFTLFRKGSGLLLSCQPGTDRFFRSEWDFDDGRYGRPFWLTIEVEQKENDLLIRWFVDGILEKEDIFRGVVMPQEYSGGGSTVWGRSGTGYQSFEGVLLEWGFSQRFLNDSESGKG